MRKLLLFLPLAGCAANAFQRPPVAAPPAPGPKLTFMVENVDVSLMGLYFAPNVIPALQPAFLPPAGMAPAAPGAAPAPGPTVDSSSKPGEPQPPVWLVRRAAGGDAGALTALKRWKEARDAAR